MPTLLARILLFLSSYAPLALMFSALLWIKAIGLAIACLVVAVIGIAGMLLYLRVVTSLEADPTKVIDCRSRDEAATSYIVTYIIPFLAVAFSEWQQAFALAIFFVILGFLYVNSGMIHINPTLNFCQYRLYEVTLENGATYNLLAHGKVQRGATLQLIRIGDEILIEKGKRKT